MKYLIVLALFGAALAGPIKDKAEMPEMPEKPEWMRSFRMVPQMPKVEFLCREGEWRPIEHPRYVQMVMQSKDMERIQALCFDVKAHALTIKKFKEDFGDCDVLRKMDLYKASMHMFHKFCIEGKGYDKCLGELFGEDGMSGQVAACAKASQMKATVGKLIGKKVKIIKAKIQEKEVTEADEMAHTEARAECAQKMQGIESCVKRSDVCRDEKGRELRKFTRVLKKRINRMLEDKNTTRHSETCKMIAEVFIAKKVEEMKQKVKEAIKNHLAEKVRDAIKEQIKEKLGGDLDKFDDKWDEIRDNVKAKLIEKVEDAKDKVKEIIGETFGDKFEEKWNEIKEKVKAHMSENLAAMLDAKKDEIKEKVKEHMEDQLKDNLGDNLGEDVEDIDDNDVTADE